jgi:hypothetical protein
MTKTRAWPNAAAWARDDAAGELVVAIHALLPVVEGQQFDRTETLRRQAVALAAAQKALLCLERVGAKTNRRANL